jgi:hypothetical protein
MAAANDSQGLKIAVAIFVTLSVIMAVMLYFSYRAYSEADANLAKEKSKASAAGTAADIATRANEALRKEIGLRTEEEEAYKAEMKNEDKKIDEEIKGMIDQVNAAVTAAAAAGATGHELDDTKNKVLSIAASFRGEKNKSYISALARLTELLKNMALLNARLSLNYVDAKRSLEGANTVNSQKMGVVEKTLADRVADLEAEHKKHAEEREILITKVDQFQTENSKLAAEIAGLSADKRRIEDDLTKKLTIVQSTNRALKDQLERGETVLDQPDGVVTFVNYKAGEVHCNVKKSAGARPQMVFSIFDKASAGLPTEKPKATITLVSVSETGSIGHIDQTMENINPIRAGDFVYSHSWSPNEPIHYALVGKIDVNRDGVDDRADLKRMIEASGGIVDYDLPPPHVGKESGKLTGKDAWYVIDERKSLREAFSNVKIAGAEQEAFDKKLTEVMKEAKLNGVRPMPIERLLPYLGYNFAAPVQGRVERISPNQMRRIQNPRQDQNKPKTEAPASDAAAKEETPKEEKDMPKEDPK